MRDPYDYPEWMAKTDYGQIAVLTLDDGERITVELSDVDTDKDELVVAVVPPDSTRAHGTQPRTIPIDRVVSYEPIGRAEKPVYADQCRNLRTTFSLPRFALWLTLLLLLVGSTLWLILTVAQAVPGQIQTLSALVYTICATWYTFAHVYSRSSGTGFLPYAITCPAVQSKLIPLALRHLAFLAILVAVLTVALDVRPLPDWFKGDGYFAITLLFVCMGIFFTEVFTNRRLLDRAHTEFFPSAKTPPEGFP